MGAKPLQAWRAALLAAWAALCVGSATAAEPTTLAVVDFDYHDSSGEPRNQKAEHAARLKEFMQSLRRDLAQNGAYRLVSLDCGAEPCTVEALTPEELFDTAKKAGARLVLFGGVHKMSTLVQWARVQVIDIERNVVIEDRHFSFRGDDDRAWRRAEAFVVKQLEQAPTQ